MSKSKRSIEELVLMTDNYKLEINRLIPQAMLKNKQQSQLLAMNIVQFVSTTEEIFNRVFHRLKGFRIKQHEMMTKIPEFGVSTEFLLAFEKLKLLRNRIVHQVHFTDPIFKYFSKNLRGLDHCQKMRLRLQTVVNTTKEETYFVSSNSP